MKYPFYLYGVAFYLLDCSSIVTTMTPMLFVYNFAPSCVLLYLDLNYLRQCAKSFRHTRLILLPTVVLDFHEKIVDWLLC